MHTAIKTPKPYAPAELPSLGAVLVNNNLAVEAIQKEDIDGSYLLQLDSYTTCADSEIASWLNITPKTLRAYKQGGTGFKDNLKEHIIMLLALFRHGNDVFGNTTEFSNWVTKPNFTMAGKSPSAYLNTISGIRFIDDRLTGIAYGDNA